MRSSERRKGYEIKGSPAEALVGSSQQMIGDAKFSHLNLNPTTVLPNTMNVGINGTKAPRDEEISWRTIVKIKGREVRLGSLIEKGPNQVKGGAGREEAGPGRMRSRWNGPPSLLNAPGHLRDVAKASKHQTRHGNSLGIFLLSWKGREVTICQTR